MADLKVKNKLLKRKRLLGLSGDLGERRFGSAIKKELIEIINSSELSVKDTYELLKLFPLRYYRWKKNYERDGISGLEDQDTGPKLSYNKILPEEREAILEAADE